MILVAFILEKTQEEKLSDLLDRKGAKGIIDGLETKIKQCKKYVKISTKEEQAYFYDGIDDSDCGLLDGESVPSHHFWWKLDE